MLSETERERIERRLLDERAAALEAIKEFDEEFSETLQEEAGELSMYRFHMADIGTEAMQREKNFLLASKEGERLYRIDEALRRLYKEPEAFGRCARCGREIPAERLEVVPEVELCAECQRVAEEPAPG